MAFTENSNTLTIQAPGRINIIGEHTDYNDGFVLPATIDKKNTINICRNGTPAHANIFAKKIGEIFSFSLNKYSRLKNGWPNYIMGVVNELQKRGANIAGFDAHIESNVPIGAGMSSSAALECGLAFALNEIFNLGFEKKQLAKICQMAEHNFVGVECGIMDQYTSMMGEKDHAVLLDCRSLKHQYIPFKLGEYQLLLLNTNVSHSLANSEYNARRVECEEGVYILQKKYPATTHLRDITIGQLSFCSNILPPKIFRRCRHVVQENARVLNAATALRQNKLEKLGRLMYQSHSSLQKDYGVSCPELDFLVNATINKNYILGSRMMGGGFGGCTINIIEKKKAQFFLDDITEKYRKQFGIDLTNYSVTIENGAGIVNR